MKIVIVQFYSYHEEVLAPQVDFLLPGNEVFVAAQENFFKNYYIHFFDSRIVKIPFNNREYDRNRLSSILPRLFSITSKYFKLFRAVKKYHITTIVFNTITEPFHFKFIKILFKNLDKIHIIHNAQNYTTEKSAKPLKIFRKNLFISFDVYNYYIANHVSQNKIEAGLFDWFLPTLVNFIPKEDARTFEKFTVVIPGSVDCGRRNYEGFLAALSTIPPSNNIQFVFLGKCPAQLQKRIIDMKLERFIKTYNEYVDGEKMLHYIKNADAVAFLIDKSIEENCRLYTRYKASGTSVFCLSFGIPCIVSNEFTLDSGLKEKAVIYSESHIENILADIAAGKLFECLKKLKNIPLPEIYSADYQRTHYRSIIGTGE